MNGEVRIADKGIHQLTPGKEVCHLVQLAWNVQHPKVKSRVYEDVGGIAKKGVV